jgi:hypothetical protein
MIFILSLELAPHRPPGLWRTWVKPLAAAKREKKRKRTAGIISALSADGGGGKF